MVTFHRLGVAPQCRCQSYRPGFKQFASNPTNQSSNWVFESPVTSVFLPVLCAAAGWARQGLATQDFLPHHLNPEMRREFRKFHAHVTRCNMFDSQFLMMTEKKKNKKKKKKKKKKEEEKGAKEKDKEKRRRKRRGIVYSNQNYGKDSSKNNNIIIEIRIIRTTENNNRNERSINIPPIQIKVRTRLLLTMIWVVVSNILFQLEPWERFPF